MKLASDACSLCESERMCVFAPLIFILIARFSTPRTIWTECNSANDMFVQNAKLFLRFYSTVFFSTLLKIAYEQSVDITQTR